MSERNFDVALFDLDGTILDTTHYMLNAFNNSLGLNLNKSITWEELYPVIGLSLSDCYRILTQEEGNMDHYTHPHNEFQLNNLHLAFPYKNSKETLEELKNNRVLIGAVTSRYGEQVQKTLELAGILDYFQVIITPLEVPQHKPEPHPVLEALRRLNKTADQAVMIGDNPVDILAGQRAGTKTIAALYGFYGERLIETNPDHSVTDISEVIPIILR
jgi:pyrophosphatase PpaX